MTLVFEHKLKLKSRILIRPNLTPDQTQTYTGLTFRVYLRLYLGLPFENLHSLGVYFGFSGVCSLGPPYSLKCEADPSIIFPSNRPLSIQNTCVATAISFLAGFTHCVHSGFTG